MKRREFLARGGAGMLALSPIASLGRIGSVAPWLLVPMDDAQSDHLKAYGLTYRLLDRGGRAEWLLNYRSGSFLIPTDAATARDAALNGVTTELLEDQQVVQTTWMRCLSKRRRRSPSTLRPMLHRGTTR